MGVSLIATGFGRSVDLVAAGVVDPDTISESDNVRGFDRASFAAHGLPHVQAHNLLQRALQVRIVRDGVTTYEGEIADVDMSSSPHAVTCDGLWEQCKRRNDYIKGFIEGRWDLAEELTPAAMGISGNYPAVNAEVITEGQLLIKVPPTTETGVSYVLVGLALAPGYNPGSIRRLICDYAISCSAWYFGIRVCNTRGRWLYQYGSDEDIAEWATPTLGSGSINDIPSTVTWADRLYIYAYKPSGVTNTNTEYLQLGVPRIYVDRTTQPTYPDAIAEIATGTGLASGSSMASSGSAVTHLMFDSETTRAAAIESCRAALSVAYDVAFWENSVCYGTVRPTAPPSALQHIALRSSDLDSDDDWSVHVPPDARLDAVAVSYEALSSSGYTDGTPKRIWYPAEPSTADARVATYSIGRATDTEATAAGTQAYLQNANVAQGSVRLPGRTLRTVSGAPVNPQHIRSLSWWVSKVDALAAEERGPFLVTSAARAADGTVTLGFDNDAYSPPGFEHPSVAAGLDAAPRTRAPLVPYITGPPDDRRIAYRRARRRITGPPDDRRIDWR